MALWNSMIYKERALNMVFKFIAEICNKNEISKIICDTAKINYKKFADSKHESGPQSDKPIILRGKNRIAMIAACLYRACEINKNPRTTKEITLMFEFDNNDEIYIKQAIKKFNQIIKNCDNHIATPEDYIRARYSKLNININIESAIKICHDNYKIKPLSDYPVESIAAASILFIVKRDNININKQDIVNLFATSISHMQQIYNILQNEIYNLNYDSINNIPKFDNKNEIIYV